MITNGHQHAPNPQDEAFQLIRALGDIQKRILELGNGEIDAILDTTGIPLLLHDAQEQLRHQALTQTAILNAIPAHIALLDTQGHIVAVNEAWQRFAIENAYANDDFGLGQNYLEICEKSQGNHAEEARATAVGIRAVLNGEKKEFTIEYPCHSPNEERWFLLKVTPANLQAREGAVVMHINVTERKRLEKQLFQAQRLESIGTMAGGIAHDINNVLAPIIMGADVLKSHIQNDDVDFILNNIQTSAKRGAELIKQVLGFARGISGTRVVLNPIHLLKEIHTVIQETFPKNITIHQKVPQDIGLLKADPTQLYQVLVNLCINARDAMPEGGQLTIALENTVIDAIYAGLNIGAQPGSYVAISVEDNGIGMSKEIQEKIFDPFFTTKDTGKGTGLGLSTAYSIVRDHSGFIHVYSEVGKGTTIKVYLPTCTDEPETETTTIGKAPLPHGNGELILLVDDEENVRVVGQKALERFGYRALLASNGEQAISLYTKHRHEIAAVITDMNMPVMDGPAMIQVLKSMDSNVRIIGSSGLHDPSMMKHIGTVVAHFVPKPYTIEILLHTLQDILSTSPQKHRAKTVSVQATTKSPQPSNGKTILVVDDEHILRRFIQRVLVAKGYTILLAENGKDAVAIWEQNAGKIDLLLTDFHLPDTDGVALAQEMVCQCPILKVLYMSGQIDIPQRINDTPMLAKPFESHTLTATIEHILKTA